MVASVKTLVMHFIDAMFQCCKNSLSVVQEQSQNGRPAAQNQSQ